MMSPPSSNEFAHLVDFVTLLADPKLLSKHVKEFNLAQLSYQEAKNKYDDAVKIAATVEKAEAMKEANEAEASRLKVLDRSIQNKEESIEKVLAKKDHDFNREIARAREKFKAEQDEFNHTVTTTNTKFDIQNEDLSKRESELANELADLEKEKRLFEGKRSRVEQAYEAA